MPCALRLTPPRWWREGRVRHDLESFETLESKSELDTLAERNGLLGGCWLVGGLFFKESSMYVPWDSNHH